MPFGSMTSILSGGNSLSLTQGTGTFTNGVVVQQSGSANGVVVFNTADQTTNFEDVRLYFNSNTATLAVQQGGSGSQRALNIITDAGLNAFFLSASANSGGALQFLCATGSMANATGFLFQTGSTFTSTSGNQIFLSLNPVYNQASGNAANTDFKIVRTETALGSGTQNLIQCFAGTTGVTEEWTVNNKGKQTVYAGIATAGLGSPAVYAAGRGTALVGASASVSSYTVGTSDGSFRVSANVNVVTSTTHTFTVTCAYTDETNVARTLTLGFTQLAGSTIVTAITNITGAGPYESISYHIRCKASTAITFATTGTFASVNYNAEGIITQLA